MSETTRPSGDDFYFEDPVEIDNSIVVSKDPLEALYVSVTDGSMFVDIFLPKEIALKLRDYLNTKFPD